MVGGASRKVRADVVPCRSALVGAGRGPRADMAFLRTSGARGLMETVNADAGRRRLGAVSGGTDRTIGADMRRSVDAVGGGRTDGADMRRSMDAMTMSARSLPLVKAVSPARIRTSLAREAFCCQTPKPSGMPCSLR